ncbi:MAG: hypothetical protein QOC60_902 [Frankiaceae bacterium]|nr:hypothetical protein [Frankiaceae bacterium]
MKRSPVFGAATGLALSSVTLIGVATPSTVSAAAPTTSAAAVASPTPTPQASETPQVYAYAGALPTEIDRGFDRASRAKRAAQAARADAALAKAAAARVRAQSARLAAAARQRALTGRITSGVASVAELRSWAHRAVNARGWSDAQWTCLDKLWTLESSWSITERNSSSGAYGIPQSLPADKMATVAADWRHNGNTQIVWGLGYIADRYGSPCNAWAHSRAQNWY